MVNINTNNGVERQNETFKHTYLNKHYSSSLTGMLSILIEEYFPAQYERQKAIFFLLINSISAVVFAGGFRGDKNVLPLITSVQTAQLT